MNIIPLIYANLITNMKIIKYSINGYYIYNIYSNRITYGNNILNLLLNSKIKFTKFTNLIYKFYNKLNNNTKDYELKNAELYINLSEKINVTDYFKNNTIISIDDNLICDIYVYFYKKIIDNKDIRLKIYYTYKNKEYILYYSYHRLYNNYNKIEFEIPYPPYTENILNNYRKDIIRPNYVISSNKTLLYSLFNIESKDIDSIILNNYKTNEYNYDKINKYINMIHGPLNDFGILYSCPVKLSWILEENNVEIETFNSLYIRFLNMYFDEEKLDLFEHKIELNRDNIDQILISNRMDYILNEKNKEIIIKNDIRKVIDILS
jgi:hypothetical protein